jgi:ankyrin repeat protein
VFDQKILPSFRVPVPGHCEAVRLLLSKGVPVDPLHYRGTPLIVAAAMGQDQVVKILLDHGADVSFSIDVMLLLLCWQLIR